MIDYFAYAVGCLKLAADRAKRDNDAAARDPWAEGYDAYKTGKEPEYCPYSARSQGEQYHKWQAGWQAAYNDSECHEPIR